MRNRLRLFALAILASIWTAGAAIIVLGADCDDRYPTACRVNPAAQASPVPAEAVGRPPVRQSSRHHRKGHYRHVAASSPAPAPAPASVTIKDARAPLHLPEPLPVPDPPAQASGDDLRLEKAHDAFAAVAIDQPILTAFFSVEPRRVATVVVASNAEAAPIVLVEAEPLPDATWPTPAESVPVWPPATIEPKPMDFYEPVFPPVAKTPSPANWARARENAITIGGGTVAAVAFALMIYLFHRIGGWSRVASGAVSILLGVWSAMNVCKYIRNWRDERRARKSSRARNSRYAGSYGEGDDEPRIPRRQVWPIGQWRAEGPRREDGHGQVGASIPDDSAIGAWARSLPAAEQPAGFPAETPGSSRPGFRPAEQRTQGTTGK